MPEFMPKLISRVEGAQTKQIVTSSYWNEIFNLLIEQGNYNTNALKDILQDGEWSLGARIVDALDVDYGRSKYLKFVNATISEDAETETTTVTMTPGLVGPEGPRGLPAPALIFKGRYDTLGALETAHPSGVLGDVYAVGAPGTVVAYGWDIDGLEWTNLGALAGIPGEGVPAGGSQYQMLMKNSAVDYDSVWTYLPDTIGYLSGLDENIMTKFQTINEALGNAQEAIELTPNKVVITTETGNLGVADVAPEKLAHLAGVTSGIQAQIDGKLANTAKAADSSKIDGRTVFISTTIPAAAVDGDIWFKV